MEIFKKENFGYGFKTFFHENLVQMIIYNNVEEIKSFINLHKCNFDNYLFSGKEIFYIINKYILSEIEIIHYEIPDGFDKLYPSSQLRCVEKKDGYKILKYINELKLFDFSNDLETSIIIDNIERMPDCLIYLLILFGVNIMI